MKSKKTALLIMKTAFQYAESVILLQERLSINSTPASFVLANTANVHIANDVTYVQGGVK